MGDFNSRCGRIMGHRQQRGKLQVVKAQCPLSEIKVPLCDHPSFHDFRKRKPLTMEYSLRRGTGRYFQEDHRSSREGTGRRGSNSWQPGLKLIQVSRGIHDVSNASLILRFMLTETSSSSIIFLKTTGQRRRLLKNNGRCAINEGLKTGLFFVFLAYYGVNCLSNVSISFPALLQRIGGISKAVGLFLSIFYMAMIICGRLAAGQWRRNVKSIYRQFTHLAGCSSRNSLSFQIPHTPFSGPFPE